MYPLDLYAPVSQCKLRLNDSKPKIFKIDLSPVKKFCSWNLDMTYLYVLINKFQANVGKLTTENNDYHQLKHRLIKIIERTCTRCGRRTRQRESLFYADYV